MTSETPPSYMMHANKIADPIKFIIDWMDRRKLRPRKIVELGGSFGGNLMGKFSNAEYVNLDIVSNSKIPTIVQDICAPLNTEELIESADLVYSNNLLEHVPNPFKAAENIVRIMRAGGICFIRAPFAYRFHAMPNDYWRFSPEALKVIFSELECVEAALDDSIRRRDFRGSFSNQTDRVPIDDIGGWRENWMTYYIGRKS